MTVTVIFMAWHFFKNEKYRETNAFMLKRHDVSIRYTYSMQLNVKRRLPHAINILIWVNKSRAYLIMGSFKKQWSFWTGLIKFFVCFVRAWVLFFLLERINKMSHNWRKKNRIIIFSFLLWSLRKKKGARDHTKLDVCPFLNQI